MLPRNSADISVLLIAEKDLRSVRKALASLAAQTLRERMEVIVLVPSAGAADAEGLEAQRFRGFRVIEAGEPFTPAHAKAAGFREAGAPIVAYTEDHSYPDPNWAEALVRAFDGPWAAVGPAVGNANPESMISWADLLILYGPWVAPRGACEAADLPGQGTGYRRSVLLEYGPRLTDALAMDGMVHWDLRARGHRLYLDPAALTYHENADSLRKLVREQVQVGRLFAFERSRPWGSAQKAAYLLGTPLIPAVRFLRVLKDIARIGREKKLLPRILPALLLGLLSSAAGEIMGYLGSFPPASPRTGRR